MLSSPSSERLSYLLWSSNSTSIFFLCLFFDDTGPGLLCVFFVVVCGFTGSLLGCCGLVGGLVGLGFGGGGCCFVCVVFVGEVCTSVSFIKYVNVFELIGHVIFVWVCMVLVIFEGAVGLCGKGVAAAACAYVTGPAAVLASQRLRASG